MFFFSKVRTLTVHDRSPTVSSPFGNGHPTGMYQMFHESPANNILVTGA